MNRRAAIGGAAVLLVVLAVSAVRWGETIWRAIAYEIVYVELRPRDGVAWIGWGHRKLWERPNLGGQAWTLFDSMTGFQVYESNWHRDSLEKKVTVWAADGKVIQQFDGPRRREAPPWLWGKTDSTSPSAPWMLEGLPVEEWRQKTFDH